MIVKGDLAALESTIAGCGCGSGATVSEKNASKIGADGRGRDAAHAVQKVKDFMG